MTTLHKPLAARTVALVSLYASETSGSVNPVKDQGITFNDLPGFMSPGAPFHFGGLVFAETNSQTNPGNLIIWGANGSDTGVGFFTNSLYQNGGNDGMDIITREAGELFHSLSFDVANGSGLPIDFLWVREFLGGKEVASLDINTPALSRVELKGEFDELRVQQYYEGAASRDQHDENGYGSISIDNIVFE
jgi:hypothetical protein